jgi:hypothetical protein
MICKFPAIDRIFSSIVLGKGRRLVFSMNKYNQASVKKFVEYLKNEKFECQLFEILDLTKIAEDFELPDLKVNF